MKKLIAIAVIIFSCSTAQAGPIGGLVPGGYSGFADSPLSSVTFNDYFYLEDFEDYFGRATAWSPGEVSTPGVTGGNGGPVSYTFGPAIHDSVDEDDGVLDGFGLQGESWFFSNGSGGVSFDFDDSILGNLPTHAGLVWTDGSANVTVTFEAFDGSGTSLGTIVLGGVGTAGNGGQTIEDTFFGWTDAGGIGSIAMSHVGGGIEVDHLQYGRDVRDPGGNIPEPSVLVLLAAGLIGLGFTRRRKPV